MSGAAQTLLRITPPLPGETLTISLAGLTDQVLVARADGRASLPISTHASLTLANCVFDPALDVLTAGVRRRMPRS